MMPNWFLEPPHAWFAPSDLALETEPEQKGGGDSASLRAIGGRINRVQLGVPQTIDLLATWPSNERLEAEIATASDRFNFYCVRLACSFVPDRGCHFINARLEVGLSSTGADTFDAPIALDLFPRDVAVKRSFSRSFGLKGGLKFAFAELSGEAGQKEEAIHYEPALTAAGLLTDSPSWLFGATATTELAGIRELFLLIKKAKNQDLSAQFRLGVEIETAWGLRRYSKERLLETAYLLKP
jgi:hypothetical protein